MVAATVVVLAGDGPRAGLVDALGDHAARAVSDLLLERALAWARAAVGSAAVHVVAGRTFADGLDAVAGGAGVGGGAGGRGGAGAGDPVIVAVPVLAVWHPELAIAALGDLADGCAVSLAPVFDGGLYLLALAGGRPRLRGALCDLDLDPDRHGHHPTGALLQTAEREGWEVGLLRPERGVRSAQDVRALLVDPLTDAELRRLLR